MLSCAKSPLSNRTPPSLNPRASSSLATTVAFSAPEMSSYVSIRRVDLFGKVLEKALNASISLGYDMIKECAMVPKTGISKVCPARTLLVPWHPAM